MHVYPLSCGLGYSFLIETSHDLYLIDSGSPGQQHRVLTKMNELGKRHLKVIWITHAHYDHYGSAAALRNLTGALIGIHPADAESITTGRSPLGSSRRYGFIYPFAQQVVNYFYPLQATPPDFTLDDGETLEKYGLNASILHTPGHTPGHSCLQLEGGIAFTGDLLGNFPRPVLQNLLATNWDQLPLSLARLQALSPERIYTGHSGYPMPGSALQKISF